MFTNDYLMLRLFRIGATEKWSRDGLHFIFARGGAGKVTVGSLSYRVSSGDVLVLNGQRDGTVSCSGASELVFSGFSLQIEHLYPLFSVQEISLVQSFSETLPKLRLYPAGSPVATECQQLIGTAPPHFNLDHRAHLLRIAAVILSEEFKFLQRGRSGFVSMEEHLVRVFEKLSAHDLLTLSTEELSAKFGCSRRHLSRLFHQHFGFSVAALRMELRMFRAVCLLRDSKAKVINIAEQCGFNHLGLFNTCFKRRFGTSPGRWRILSANAASDAAPGKDTSECPFHFNGLCPMLRMPKSGKSAASVRLKSVALSAVLGNPKNPAISAAALDIPPPDLSPESSSERLLNISL